MLDMHTRMITETSCIIKLLLRESSSKATIDLLLYVATSLYAIIYVFVQASLGTLVQMIIS